MHDPRKGPLTRREAERGGRRDVDESRERDGTDPQPLILLVEDDEAALSGLTQWLAGQGFRTVGCNNFTEARAQLTTRRVGALLTDIRLGEYNGLHLVQLARSLHPGARLVVFSGFADEVLQRETQSFGAQWMLKPLDLEQLRQHLAGLDQSDTAAPEPARG